MRRGLLLQNVPPEWNIKVLTEEDFYYYCDSAGIVVQDRPLSNLPGLYLICDGRPCIFLDDELRGAERLFVAFHELAHHWLGHPPYVHMFHGQSGQSEQVDIEENEADLVAICCLIPGTMLHHYHPSEIAELHGYPHWIVRLRYEFFDKWKI